MSNNHKQFRAVSHFGEPLIINEIENNLSSFLRWSLLSIGGYNNVTTGTQGSFGGSLSQLHLVDDKSYPTDTVFQGIRKDWIWETGATYIDPTGGTNHPLQTQVYVNGSLKTTGAAGYQHYIDYPNGRVVFTSGQTGTISAQYSYSEVQIYTADDTNWWMEVNYDSFNPSDFQWSQNIISGDYSLSATNRAQLPTIVIEAAPTRIMKPFELGTLVNKNKQDILIHVVTENRYTRNNLVDILALQKHKTIVLYDTDKVYNGGFFPLDERGMTVSNPQTYSDIIDNNSLVFRSAFIDDITITNIDTKHPKLHWAILRLSIEVIF